MFLGGTGSVRGFVEQGAGRDYGLIWQNELRLPSLAGASRTLSLVPFVFADYGGGDNRKPIGDEWVSLMSVGPGIDFVLTDHAAFRLTYGVPVETDGTVGPLQRAQFLFSLSL